MRRGGEGEERRQRRQKSACDGVTGFVDSQGIAGTQFDPEITKKGPVSKLPPRRKPGEASAGDQHINHVQTLL